MSSFQIQIKMTFRVNGRHLRKTETELLPFLVATKSSSTIYISNWSLSWNAMYVKLLRCSTFKVLASDITDSLSDEDFGRWNVIINILTATNRLFGVICFPFYWIFRSQTQDRVSHNYVNSSKSFCATMNQCEPVKHG